MKLKLFAFILFLSSFSLTCFAQIVKEKELPGLIISYVEKHYNASEYKIISSEIKEDENQRTTYYLQVKKKGESKSVTELFFDMSGNFIKKLEPVEKEIEEELGNIKILEKEGDNPEEIFSTNQQVNLKELPGLIISYIEKHYNTDEYKIISSEIKKDENQRTTYYLQVKKKGESKSITELFFDMSGNFIKKIEPIEKEIELENADIKNNDSTEEELQVNKELKPKEIPGPIVNYFKSNFNNVEYKITLAKIKEKKNGERYYYIQVRKKGVHQPIASELFFDLSGNLIKKVNALEKKMEREFSDTEDVKTLEEEQVFSTNQQVEPKELPGLIISYVEKHYNKVEYKIISSEIKEDKNQRPVYHLQIKEKGKSQNITELFFDMSGKFIKKITPIEKQMEQEEFSDTEDVKTIEKEEKEDTPEEIFSTNQQVNPKELPGTVISYVKKHYISAKYKIILSEIKEDKNQRPVYHLQIKEKGESKNITELFFDMSGKFIKKITPLEKQMEQEEFSDTENVKTIEKEEDTPEEIFSTSQQINPKELPGTVINYVKKNYISAKYKIILSEIKEDENKRPVYHLQIKEKGESKNITELFFDISGKFIKKITPLEKQMEQEEFDDE